MQHLVKESVKSLLLMCFASEMKVIYSMSVHIVELVILSAAAIVKMLESTVQVKIKMCSHIYTIVNTCLPYMFKISLCCC